MSLGRTSTFLDVYAERDLALGTFTEEQIQEFVDHFIMKLRIIKFARTPEYNDLFSGDPVWITESLAGVGVDGTPHGDKNVLPLSEYLNQPGAFSRAQPDGSVVHQTSA